MLGVRPEKLPNQRHEWIGPAPYVAKDIPGPNAAAILRAEHLSRVPAPESIDPIVARRAYGSVIEDVDGNRFLDFTAALTVGPVGHAHPKVIARANERMSSMSFDGVSVITTEDSALCKMLASIAGGLPNYEVLLESHANQVYESAVALARKNRRRETIVSFHPIGDSQAPAVGNSSGVVILDWPFNTIEFHQFKAQLERTGVRKSDIAAIVMTPFATMRSCDLPDAPFTEALATFCHDNGILLLFDETVSGMGRSGSWFVCRQLGITPDMILVSQGLAAGMPLGALLVQSPGDLDARPRSLFRAVNPVSSAAATAALDVVANMSLDHVNDLGACIGKKLIRISESSRNVGRIGGTGLLQFVEVANRKSHRPDSKLRNAVLNCCLDRGLLLKPVGDSGFFVSPAACINDAQLDVGCRILEEAISFLP